MITDPSVLREINHRNDLPFFLNRHGTTGYAAEIGTYKGDFAEIMLLSWTGKRLFLIDPYQPFPPDEYRDGSTKDDAGNPVDYEALFWKTHARLNPFPAAYFMRLTSAEAASKGMIFSGDLDMVFIDANHSKENANEDIMRWWSKLHRGGIMGLHDCYTRDDQYQKCGVFDAVMDFAEGIRQRPHLTVCTTAWFLKV